ICSGTTTTLTAQGGTSYTLTSPFTVNTTGSFVVSPMVTTVYTIIATNSFNCSKTMTINVIVNPSPNFTVSPTSVCLGLSNTLTASGAINYTWTVWPTANPANKTVTPNSSSVVITPTASMTFSLCSSTNSNNCVRCTTSVINMGVPVPMSVSDMTMCTSASNCTNISVSTATTTNCTWQPTANISGSPNGATVNVCPVTFPATYTVFATSTATNTCPNQAVMSVYQETNCCSQPTTGLTVLSGIQGIYFNGNYLLNTSQSLLGDTYLRSSEVWITPGVQLTVPSGSLLSLEHVHMFACSDRMWKGIKLMDAAILTTPQASTATHQNSLIEDAEIAVDVDYSTMNMSNPTPTISIEGTIFNKNHIGIRMANMPPGTSLNGGLDLNVNGCIFSSRNMPFTTYPTPGLSLSWPSSALVSPGLKVASNSTAGLNPPYIFPGMAQAFTKQPYNTQPGYIGIELKKLNDSLAAASGSTNGVVIMNILQGASIAGDFVLFDGLSYGIDIYEAGLVSKNLVFQNTQTVSVAPSFTPEGGDGVRHRMTSLVNTNFDLYPSQGNGTFGMRCWDCVRGLNIENVYHVSVPNSIFRSTQWAVNATAPNMQGAYGIYAMTNRFNYNFSWNEFNNVRKGISINTPAITQNYDMGGNGLNPVPGIFADYLNIGANYFGPEVNSSTGYSSGSANVTEFMETAVEIITPNTNGWANSIQSSGLPNGYIYFNKLDRVFRGITINGTEDFPLSVEQNSVYVEDDFTFGLAPGNPAPGWGISLSNSTNAKTISTNTLESMGNAMATNSVSLVHCYYNFGNQSPNVHCNFTKNAHYGFQFEDRNDSTVWGGNHMCNQWAGLALVNGGVIGQQGTPAMGCENFWEATPTVTSCVQWNQFGASQAKWQTYADNSNASLSPLYIFPGPNSVPTINGNNPSGGTPYSNSAPASVLNSAAHNTLLLDCSLTNSIMPTWRMDSSGTTFINQQNESLNEDWVSIYPNPTNGDLNVLYEGAET
ncbi:MAG: hypothetical protein JNL60_07990, partial [Bacteroidia bacterium]|nr:hypothetical protein [Bacteroidia bacterium]